MKTKERQVQAYGEAHTLGKMSPLWVGWTLLAFLLPLASPSPLYGLLIVTGDVTHNSARVLVQALPEAPAFPDFAAQPRLPLPSQCASARMTVEFDSRDGLVSFTPISVTLDATPKVRLSSLASQLGFTP